MIPLPNLSNNQMAQSGQSVGSFTVISGGVDNLRTMMELRRGNPEVGGIPFDYAVNTGGISSPVGASFTLPGASGGFKLSPIPIAILIGAILLWKTYRK